MTGSTRSMHLDLRRGSVDFIQVLRGQLDLSCAKVFLQAGQLARAGNRNDEWFLKGQSVLPCPLRSGLSPRWPPLQSAHEKLLVVLNGAFGEVYLIHDFVQT